MQRIRTVMAALETPPAFVPNRGRDFQHHYFCGHGTRFVCRSGDTVMHRSRDHVRRELQFFSVGDGASDGGESGECFDDGVGAAERCGEQLRGDDPGFERGRASG